MTSKRKPVKQADTDAAKQQEQAAQTAKLAVSPVMTAALVSKAFSQSLGKVDLAETTSALLEQTQRVHKGDLRGMESMLSAQSTALNSIFTDMALRASMNTGEYMHAAALYMKLALRAQSQCRATLETLAAIKNPPVVFAKQANIAHGPQQVNNGESNVPPARAEENANVQTGLLEPPHAKPQWMDATTAGTAAAGDPPLAAVAAFDRPAHG